MMQRILELPDEVLTRYDLSKLRVVAVSGSALPGSISDRWMDLFGENIYNLYGSTEVAWASIATPADLRAAPGTAGRAAARHDRQALRRRGQAGRARARPAASSSATRCSSRATRAAAARTSIDGLLSSGDVGHFDAAGRLFVDGRDDDMIVSGGENVFPAEVEDLLSGHEAIAEVAVFGVDDEKFGQRLKAVVVLREGASATEDDAQEARQGQPRRPTRCRARSTSWTSCRARRRARSSSAS